MQNVGIKGCKIRVFAALELKDFDYYYKMRCEYLFCVVCFHLNMKCRTVIVLFCCLNAVFSHVIERKLIILNTHNYYYCPLCICISDPEMCPFDGCMGEKGECGHSRTNGTISSKYFTFF